MAPKSKPKSMLSSKGVFFEKKRYFSIGKYIFLKSRGSKLGTKIDQQTEQNGSCVLKGILKAFLMNLLSKMEAKCIQIRYQFVHCFFLSPPDPCFTAMGVRGWQVTWSKFRRFWLLVYMYTYICKLNKNMSRQCRPCLASGRRLMQRWRAPPHGGA